MKKLWLLSSELELQNEPKKHTYNHEFQNNSTSLNTIVYLSRIGISSSESVSSDTGISPSTGVTTSSVTFTCSSEIGFDFNSSSFLI